MLERHSLNNLLTWAQQTLDLGTDDAVLQATSFSFDIAILELLGALGAGSRLILSDPARLTDRGYLPDLICHQAITILQMVPSLARLLIAQPETAGCLSLRHILCGGEAMPADLAADIRRVLPGAVLHNLYGPTETTIYSTHYRPSAADTAPVVPIGTPIANTTIRLLDEAGARVAPGAAGEICIGGAGVARGYLGRPDLTADRFIPDPDGSGGRLYRTGDLGRHRPDGSIEFLGRRDFQIKLRGFRIEPGEIEATLNSHPLIRQSVVTVREDTPGDRRLTAYFVGDTDPGQEALRRHLASGLPDYMTPAAFVRLERMPLTANGKLDRSALPAPQGAPLQQTEFVPPQTPIEQAVAAIWADILKQETIGLTDDFFALGGHSLLAARMIGRLRDQLGVDIPLKVLFDRPTIRQLLDHIFEQLAAETTS